MQKNTIGSLLFALTVCGWIVQHVTALLTPLSDSTERSPLLSCGATAGRRKIFADALAVVAGIVPTSSVLPHRAAATNEDSLLPSGNSNNHYATVHNPLLSVESAARLDTLKGRLRLYPDPALRTTAAPVRTSLGSRELETVTGLLIEAMIGNATTALQYGIDARIVVLRGASSPSEDGEPLVLVNPNVLARSSEDKMVPWRESCGVIPHPSEDNQNDSDNTALVEIDLLRDAVVEVAAQDVTGKPVRKALSGEAARAFQHELDHLNGILIVDHADLADLPASVAKRESQVHGDRQKKAFERTLYAGNGPLYW
mmetsp:Transcript_6445/g.16002  ORF Transcript_6445/g.16002 Transcript_6445/m.16002 type:complete len:313 (-) Transcript_6445:330-1268(-)